MRSELFETTDKLICSGCVKEPALKSTVECLAESARTCFFCDQSPAASLDELLRAFFEGLKNEFEVVGYMGDLSGANQGKYQLSDTLTTWELIERFPDAFGGDPYYPGGTGPPHCPNPVLTEVFKSVREHLWIDKSLHGPRRDEALSASWSDFSDIVKFKTRFVLWRIEHNRRAAAGEIAAPEILDEVQNLVVDHGLIEEIPAGTSFWRARTHRRPVALTTASQLGTAPVDKALRGTRMSPAGMPKFYGAHGHRTAVREAAHGSEHEYASYGRFEVTSDILIVDFARVPQVPSMFDPQSGARHRELNFLQELAAEISQRVESDLGEVEYVPTQVICEYLLQIRHETDPIIGLRYKSSITGKPCIALDIPNDGTYRALSPNV